MRTRSSVCRLLFAAGVLVLFLGLATGSVRAQDCEAGPFPECDGFCPPGEVCRTDDPSQRCVCEPSQLACEQGPWPECEGECPPDEICVESPVAQFCVCQPIPCEQGDPLVCDGPCPNANEVCTIDPAGGPCFCEVPQLPCEQTSPPICDGFCADPTEACTPIATDVILGSPELPPESDPPDCDQILSQYEGQGVHVLFPGGIDLSDPIHKCFQNVIREAVGADEIETFDSVMEGLIDVGDGPTPVTLTGPVTVVTSDKVGQTTGTFDTEIVSMSLSGVVGSTWIEIRESPTLVSQGQTTITDLGGGLYHIDSFFDVFTELSVDGGPFQAQLNEAGRMTLVPTAEDSCVCQPIPCEQGDPLVCDGPCPNANEVCTIDPAGGPCFCEVPQLPCEQTSPPICDGFCADPTEACTPIATDVILGSPELPPESDPPDCDQILSQYEGQGVHVLFPGGIDLSDPIHKCFQNVIREAVGADEIETFDSVMEGLIDVGDGPTPVTLTGPVTVVTSDKVGQTTGTFDTEIVSMSLSGVVGSTWIEIRESPTLVSQGQTTITDLGGGLYHIDSFFDVFTELSVDGGPFQAQLNEAGRMTLVPTAEDSCVCQPIPCEQSPYPTCDGICPGPEVCVPDPTGLGVCRCEPPTCDAAQAPVCGGNCPPNERCTPLNSIPGGPCECTPCIDVTPGPNIWIDWPNKTTLQWVPTPCALVYNLYRLTLPRLVDSDSDGLADHYGFCFQPNLLAPQAIDGGNPPIGALHHYLVTGENSVGEGRLGFSSQLMIRPNYTPCP